MVHDFIMYVYMYTYMYMYNVCTCISDLMQAFKQGDSDSRYVSGFVWLIHGWYKLRWWTAEVAQDSEVDCTDDQLEQLLKRSLAILQIPTADNTTAPTDVELVSILSWAEAHFCTTLGVI